MDTTLRTGVAPEARSAGQGTGAACRDQYMSTEPLTSSLTRFELGIVRVYEAFSSWALELQKYVSGHQVSFQEVALLHCVRLRGGVTTLAEMMMFLHRHDLAAINYSLRKLEQNGWIKRMRGPYRREVAYAITDAGREVTDAYGRMRDKVLVALCREVLGMQASTNDAAAVLERMIGIYDQATQQILNQSLISAALGSAGDQPVAAEPGPAAANPVGPAPAPAGPAATPGSRRRATPSRSR
ncbi:MAG: winged helix DNA-binding protein [Steroidobacteraceae bacterium]|jgi:predicted MarR family transcription regulator|nr:winged helix DNA-binding protein [Steroidobacteraceae bacterium]